MTTIHSGPMAKTSIAGRRRLPLGARIPSRERASSASGLGQHLEIVDRPDLERHRAETTDDRVDAQALPLPDLLANLLEGAHQAAGPEGVEVGQGLDARR